MDGSLVATQDDMWEARERGNQVDRENILRYDAMSAAYVWGRQDAGESVKDTGNSFKFRSVYTMAKIVSGGHCGPLQSTYHEWRATGRVLVRVYVPGTERVASIECCEDGKTTARLIPWIGNTTPYYPGIHGNRGL